MKKCTLCEIVYPNTDELCSLCKKSLIIYNPQKGDTFYSILQRYKIEAILGIGRHAAVYKIQHLDLNLTRALKILHQDRMRYTDRARFAQEAKILCQLNHGNIVKVYDASLLDGFIDSDSDEIGLRPYFIMDFIVGKPLSELLNKQRQLDFKSALRIGAQIASGLAYAHENGFIHRDICPQNIFIDRDSFGRDAVKIIDFGVSKHLQGTFIGWNTPQGEERFLGHPHFMSPEMLLSEDIDTSTDEYSLGCVLYQMLTGRLPFDGETLGDIQRNKIIMKTPVLTEQISKALASSGDFDALDQLIQRMMDRKPFRRFNNMHEIERILTRYVRDSRCSIVFCNAEDDTSFLSELKRHMSSLLEEQKILSWDIEKIPVGANLEQEMIDAVGKCDIILLLLSSEFFYKSPFWTNDTIRQIIIEKLQNHYASVMPIIVRETDLPVQIKELKCLPHQGSVKQYRNRDKAWHEIVVHVRKSLQKIESMYLADSMLVLGE